ncbi:MAG: type II secretion system inner membrane protein GspF [Sinobacterium sp.]|nr:type II secretion system inner membrane protein GspF [Sinobacterium sp.]
MGAFSYQAIDASGKKVKGIIDGDSAKQVRQLLREKSLTPLEVNESRGAKGTKASADKNNADKVSLLAGFRSVKLKSTELALFTRQLATLVKASMPLDEALQAAAQQTTKPQIKMLIVDLRSKVLEGHTLAYALGEFPKVFDNMYQAMVKAGESAGFLGVALERLADYTENSQFTQQKVKSAMIYPIILSVVAFAVVAALMVKVVPNLVKVFDTKGAELPGLTQALIVISDFMVDYGLVTLIVFLMAVAGIRQYFQKPAPKKRLHAAMLKMPMISNLYRTIETARFASTLSMLVASGVPLLQALRIAGAVMNNLILREVCEEIADNVQEGSSFSRALDASGQFPPMLVHMVSSGEQAGELEQMLERVSSNQEREIDMTISSLVAVIEPLMIVFMSGIVMTIVIAILLPIMDLNTLA